MFEKGGGRRGKMDGNGMRGKCAGKGGEVRPCYGLESSAKERMYNTGLPRKDKISVAIAQHLFIPFSYIQGSL